MARRALLYLAALAVCALLIAVEAAPAGPAPPVVGASGGLAGRNCGGTTDLGGLALAAPAQSGTGGAGWTIGGAVDESPGAIRQIRPSIAVSQAGQVFYAWQEVRAGDGGDIFAALSTAPPTSGRRAVRVDDSGKDPVEQAAPALAVGPDGRLHAVWEDLRAGQRRLYYAASSDGGASWGPSAPVGGPAGDQVAPALLAAADGRLYLAWASGGDILVSSRGAGGWGAPVPLNAVRAGARGRPRLVGDAGGGLVAAWQDQRGGAPAIYTARLADPAAGAWGAELRASPAGVAATQPSLAAGQGGALYIAYQGLAGIFLIASGDGGASWGAPERVDDGDGGSFTNPQVAVDAEGGVHCVWCRLRVDVQADIVAARSPDGGASWGEPVLLASTTGTAEPLALVADGAGRVHAAWSDDGGGAPSLHTAVWSDGFRLLLPLVRS